MTTTIETVNARIDTLPQANIQEVLRDILKLIEKMGAEVAARDSADAEHMQEIIHRHSADPAIYPEDMQEQVSKERSPGESELMLTKDEIENDQTITEESPPEDAAPIADAEGSGPEGQLPDEPTFPVYDSIDDIDEPLTEDVQDATDKGNTE